MLIGTVSLVMVTGMAACTRDIALPEPKRLVQHRESHDWIKPGARVPLRGALRSGARGTAIRITNIESFAWTPVDDAWLSVSAPNVQMRPDGPYIEWTGRWHVFLRCPTPRTIPAGAAFEIPYDACVATTYEPGTSAHVVGIYLAAQEGALSLSIGGGMMGPLVIRQPKSHGASVRAVEALVRHASGHPRFNAARG